MFDEYRAFDYLDETYDAEQCASDYYAYVRDMYAYEARDESVFHVHLH